MVAPVTPEAVNTQSGTLRKEQVGEHRGDGLSLLLPKHAVDAYLLDQA